MPPVRDLTTLPDFLSASVQESPPNATVPPYPAPPTGPGTPGVDPIVTANSGQLPTYDADIGQPDAGPPYQTRQAMAWGTQQLTIDDNQSVNLGISASNPAFQDMINGLRAAKTAADQAGTYSTADRDNYMEMAVSSLTKAVGELRTLSNSNDITDSTLTAKSTEHTATLNLISTNLDGLVGIDTTQVTAQLSSVNNQLNASYKATSTLLGLSLINYLK